MNENASTTENPDLSLKQPEPPIPKDGPWKYDALQRKLIAGNLTNLIRDQKNPFVVSVDGDWGTGKTFLLQRWQAQLEKDRFRAIYFNAWEDDFCDDPLVAIIGQLAEYFQGKGLEKIGKQFKENVIPLLMSILRGLSVSVPGVGVELSLPDSADLADDVFEQYSKQTKSKNDLKDELKKLADAVTKETGHPLVFIIDELDRCRPTFAVELLERVKHVFDVPGIVFVFGLNRRELAKSVQSLYGNIDADIYLHRFFNMEFRLPEADAKAFCEYLIAKRYELDKFYKEAEAVQELAAFKNSFPGFSGSIGLSLRDIDYCVRTMAFVGKNLDKNNSIFTPYYHFVLAALIPLKLKNLPLYQKFIQGKSASASAEVVDCIDGWIDDKRDVRLDGNNELEDYLDIMELYLYASAPRKQRDIGDEYPLAIEQLRLLAEGDKAKGELVTHPEYLSQKCSTPCVTSKDREGKSVIYPRNILRKPKTHLRARKLWGVYQKFLEFYLPLSNYRFLPIEEIVKLIELTKPPQDR